MSQAARLLIRCIAAYRRRGGGSALLVDCNFEPSCSHYTEQALRRHGFLKGMGLGIGRLMRCRERDQIGKRADPVP
jgi:hypothetical protein